MTTRHYRAPEIIYGSKHYDESIDIWGLGCTIAELLLHQTLFPGTSDIQQLEFIFSVIGYPVHLHILSKNYGLRLKTYLITCNLMIIFHQKVSKICYRTFLSRYLSLLMVAFLLIPKRGHLSKISKSHHFWKEI